ncbi:MAG: GIY-YIG nuclease family protein, partial [Haliscomenobacteraceae bacterium CHB4]|nr:GIY-YIG nuclease family protein [Haliscomenobacteraceae bacterium CHB4]
MYYTYILYSESLDRYYIGSCENLEKRLHDHQVGHSNYTKHGKPWVLKWSRPFETRQQAVAEEYRIKAKKSRKYIEYLI